ncbi:MAG TPA: GNAT family N-acetyltransferase [Gemmatimonadaceae bacterium]|nr:GNAT family N-acetyltransferase [Gemmatimonadaceae bacterium]
MPAPEPIALRPLDAGDAAAARALLAGAWNGGPHRDAARDALEMALTGTGEESRGIVAEQHGALVGLVAYGMVAGSEGAGKLHLVAVAPSARRRGVGRLLCGAAFAQLESVRARLVIAEMADDPRLAAASALLAQFGLREEARVPDFYADGRALRIMRGSWRADK